MLTIENIIFGSIRNEWIGWGNVNKKKVYMLDYEKLKKQILYILK